MVIIVRVVVKEFNSELLREELVALGLPMPKFKGFESSGSAGFYTPNAARRVIARRTSQGGPDITDSANPGELRFSLDSPLTSRQESDLDGVLAAHDSTQRTAEQTSKI